MKYIGHGFRHTLLVDIPGGHGQVPKRHRNVRKAGMGSGILRNEDGAPPPPPRALLVTAQKIIAVSLDKNKNMIVG